MSAICNKCGNEIAQFSQGIYYVWYKGIKTQLCLKHIEKVHQILQLDDDDERNLEAEKFFDFVK